MPPHRALPRPAAGRRRHADRLARRGLDAARPRGALSERLGLDVWLKCEGANPTGSFKDRGMTVAVVARARAGRAGRDLRVDREHRRVGGRLRGSRRAAGGRAPAGGRGRARQAGAGACARRPLLEVRGTFDQALAAARELAGRGTHVLVNSLNPDRIEGQKTAAFEIAEELGRIAGRARAALRRRRQHQRRTRAASTSAASCRASSPARRPSGRRPWHRAIRIADPAHT